MCITPIWNKHKIKEKKWRNKFKKRLEDYKNYWKIRKRMKSKWEASYLNFKSIADRTSYKFQSKCKCRKKFMRFLLNWKCKAKENTMKYLFNYSCKKNILMSKHKLNPLSMILFLKNHRDRYMRFLLRWIY